jgi:hypothetical protein
MKKVNKHKQLFLTGLLIIAAMPAFAQMQKGRWAVGGEFSFLNTHNDQSNSSYSFAQSSNTGFNFDLMGGKFVRNDWYVYGVFALNYSKSSSNQESNIGSKEVNRRLATALTPSLGAGVRKYIRATDRMGFFVQGQASFSNTFVRNEYYYVDNDTVQQDVKARYPFYSLTFNINPGVYVNLAKRWQLTFNLGNLYFIQTWQPEKKGVITKTRNASFGADINLFDFRIGALYFLGKNL